MSRTLTIDVTDAVGQSHPGDYVLIEVPRARGSADAVGRIIHTAPYRIDLVDGVGQARVEPGPLLVTFRCRNRRDSAPVEVIVPTGTGNITLRSLMEMKFTFTPPVVSAVQAAADRAADSERAAIAAQRKTEAKAGEVDTKVKTVIRDAADLVRGEVKNDADRAQQAKRDAEGIKASTLSEAGAQVEKAKQYADRADAAAGTAARDTKALIQQKVDEATRQAGIATTQKTLAQAQVVEATEQASAARSSAEQARSSASAAGSSATSSRQSAEASGNAQRAAEAARDRAETAQSQASTAKDEALAAKKTAETKANEASTSRQEAGSAEAKARQHAEEAKQAAAAAKTSAPPTGWPRNTLAEDVRTSLQRADSSLQSFPKASSSAAGGVRLAGDLSGSADSPRVTGLSDKLGQSDTSVSATANKIAKRDSAGHVNVPETPTSTTHAASKRYVDSTTVSSSEVSVSAEGSKIAQRGSTGHLYGEHPTDERERNEPKTLATVKWVKEKLAGQKIAEHADWPGNIKPPLFLPIGLSVACRLPDGQLKVKEIPTADDNAASKKYVDSKTAGALQGSTGPSAWGDNSEDGKAPVFTEGGTIKVSDVDLVGSTVGGSSSIRTRLFGIENQLRGLSRSVKKQTFANGKGVARASGNVVVIQLMGCTRGEWENWTVPSDYRPSEKSAGALGANVTGTIWAWVDTNGKTSLDTYIYMSTNEKIYGSITYIVD